MITTIVTVISCVYLAVYYIKLIGRIDELEKKVERLSKRK